MKKVHMEEESWVKFISDGKVKLGKVKKKWKSKPFSSKNFWVYVLGQGNWQPDLEDIIYVYPKIFIRPVHELAWHLEKEPVPGDE